MSLLFSCISADTGKLHFVFKKLLDFKFDLFKERYEANHGLSVLRGEQGIWLLNQIFSES